MALSLRFGAVSDIGRIRKKNDDSGYAGPHLIVVADGMGGAPAGDLASAVAIQTIKRLDVAPPDDLLQALAGTILIANERLAEIVEDDPTVDGMGTTVTAALFDGAQIGVAHLGDSRGYLWRAGQLMRITRDHSWVQSLIDEGRISDEEAKVHSHRSLLLKVLDGRHDNEPDLSCYDVQAGDRILICSDGLTGFVPDDRIERVLAVGTAQDAATELTTLALESGSTDNVTVLVGDVVDEPADEAAEPLVVGAAGDRHRGPLTRLRTWAHRDEPEPGEMLMADPSVDPEQLRYAPRAPRRLLWLRRLGLLGLALIVICGGLAAAYQWSQTQYFVAADGKNVAIYQGVNAQLPGIRLNHVYADQQLRLSQLPGFRRSQVLGGMSADSLGKAEGIVAQLLGFAKICQPPPANPPATLPPPPTKPTSSPPTTTRPGGSGATIAPPSSLLPPGSQSPDTPRECAGSTPGKGTPR
ncbi:MAG: family protein phosphatase [Nocardioidaceae bacterium]|nr:family protein phosphatase [Nocardioidaceae bacterium]MDX6309181.1 family protein phosphatase [Nocardioidaceae bacterium]